VQAELDSVPVTVRAAVGVAAADSSLTVVPVRNNKSFVREEDRVKGLDKKWRSAE